MDTDVSTYDYSVQSLVKSFNLLPQDKKGQVIELMNRPEYFLQDQYNNDNSALQGIEGPDYRFKITKAYEALNERPDPDYLIDKLIRPESVNALVGDGGTKKTYIAIWMAVRTSLGLDWCGLKTKSTRVLYIDEEMSLDYFLDRIAEVIRGHHEIDPRSIDVDIISGAGFNLRDPSDQAILEAIIQENDYGLVILDAMSDLMPGADENTAKDITPFFLNLRATTKKTGCAFLLIHHTNKTSGSYRGSTDIKSKLDLMLMVQSEPDSKTIIFKTEKIRYGAPLQLSAKVSWENQSFILSESFDDHIEFMTKGEEYVLRFLSDGPKSRPEILGSTDSCTERQAKEAIYKLVQKGSIYRTNPGLVGRGNEAIYAIKGDPFEWGDHE